jgi:peptide/nickel transport system substrate-binding protein
VNRQPRTLLSLLLIAVLLGTAYAIWRDLHPPAPGGASSASVAAPSFVRGGSATTVGRAEPRSFNRLVSRTEATELYSVLTQGRLVRVNRATGELEPWLAERWTSSADGRIYTLTLRDGLTWSDGTPFTSADVAFTFRAVYDPKVQSVLTAAVSVDGKPLGIDTPDARTVVDTYPSTFGPGLRLLDNLAIAPKHKLEAAYLQGTLAQAWNAATPPSDLASIGPFVLSRYEPGQRLVYERNPKYWRIAPDGQRLPYLDRLTVEIVPDQNAEALGVQAGKFDLTYQPARLDDVATYRSLEREGKLRVLELGVSTDPDAFFFNLRPAYWAKDPRRAWLTSKVFRQAISRAVDREAFADTVFLGAAVPVWGPISPGNKEWFTPNLPRYPFSVAEARKQLATIGLTSTDQDEWLEDAAGTDARFSLITVKGSTVLERSASVLRDDLKAAGIAVDVVPLEFGALIDRMLKGDFEAILFNYTATDLDPAMSKDFWLSSGQAHIWNIAQSTPNTEWERQIDALMARQAATTDAAERKRLFTEVQKIFADELPVLYFVAPRLYMGVSARLTNLTPAVLRPQLLWSADTIAVTQ